MRNPIKRAKLMAEINITPFTDVVLVLLIIFMITTPMLIQPGIKVNLPKAEIAESQTDRKINILIDSSGKIFLNEDIVSFEQLKMRLIAKISGEPGIPVVIKGDKNVKYDTVIRVIDTAKQAGAKKFALAVELQKNILEK
ncbi:ExbD/TolR family protein [Elusimicrobiota bacterium]